MPPPLFSVLYQKKEWLTTEISLEKYEQMYYNKIKGGA